MILLTYHTFRVMWGLNSFSASMSNTGVMNIYIAVFVGRVSTAVQVKDATGVFSRLIIKYDIVTF